MTILIENIGRLALTGRGPQAGPEMGRIDLMHDALVLIDGTTVSWIEPRRHWMRDATPDHILDACGGLVIPGLIDPHTHLCFAEASAVRADEPARGRDTPSPQRGEGGYTARVRAVVAATRDASRADLAEALRARLRAMFAAGVTTAEVKSGLGLSPAQELKSLEAVRDVALSEPIEIVPTFFGAHIVPPEFDDARAEYLEQVVKQMVPAVAHGGLADFCDVFCDAGGFTADEARVVLARAGTFEPALRPKVHAGLFEDRGAARLAAEIGAVSVDHLVHVCDNDLTLLAAAGTVAVLLPAAASAFGTAPPSARKMIDAGMIVALGSDAGPFGGVGSLAEIRALAAGLGMSPEEILTACTANAAAAVGRADRLGALEPGMQADLVVLEGRTLGDWVDGCPVRAVIKHGRLYGGEQTG
jgi:imidazolonepropionase